MKSVTRFVSKKSIFTASLILAGLIALPSCKHKSGGCDAYQGSGRSNFRSVKKHHAEVIRTKNDVFIA